MIYLQLFWTFFKIGLFSFGGGYAMIQVIREDVEAFGWISASEYSNIVAISQMTPGPLAVNAATYVGVKVAGFWGSFFSTLGVSLPSFIIILIIARFITAFKESNVVNSVLKGIRPVTVGLIGSAVIFFAAESIFTLHLTLEKLSLLFAGNFPGFFEGMKLYPGAVAIFVLVLVASKKFKMHPIAAIACSAVLGIILL